MENGKSQNERDILEDRSKLVEYKSDDFKVEDVCTSLQNDSVVIIRNVDKEQADELMLTIAKKFELGDQLKLQSGFATLREIRDNVGKYFMTSNPRTDYQVIPPHCESSRFSDMQLASFYCHENDVIGGETILLHLDPNSPCWEFLKERGVRIKYGDKKLTTNEIAKARAMLSIDPEKDVLLESDIVLEEHSIPGTDAKFYDALAQARKSYSKILSKDVHTYWANMAGVDFDAFDEYLRLLKQWGLFRYPPSDMKSEQMDPVREKRVYRSGLDFSQLFSSKLTIDLKPGDFVIQNNMTWTHSSNNYEPSSGKRNIAVAFA